MRRCWSNAAWLKEEGRGDGQRAAHVGILSQTCWGLAPQTNAQHSPFTLRHEQCTGIDTLTHKKKHNTTYTSPAKEGLKARPNTNKKRSALTTRSRGMPAPAPSSLRPALLRDRAAESPANPTNTYIKRSVSGISGNGAESKQRSCDKKNTPVFQPEKRQREDHTHTNLMKRVAVAWKRPRFNSGNATTSTTSGERKKHIQRVQESANIVGQSGRHHYFPPSSTFPRLGGRSPRLAANRPCPEEHWPDPPPRGPGGAKKTHTRGVTIVVQP